MMASSLHNAHHAWISHVLADLLYKGHLTSIEHTELIAESATSEYGCIPVNFLAYTTQPSIILLGFMPEARKQQISQSRHISAATLA